MLIHCLLVLSLLVGVLCLVLVLIFSTLCLSSFAIILIRKRELVALLWMSSRARNYNASLKLRKT